MTGTDPNPKTPSMSQARRRDIEDLANFVQECGAVEHNSWIDAGLLCRRYITSDGSIDLTVRVP